MRRELLLPSSDAQERDSKGMTAGDYAQFSGQAARASFMAACIQAASERAALSVSAAPGATRKMVSLRI